MYKATISVLTQNSERTNSIMAEFVSMFLRSNVIKKEGDTLQEAIIDKKQQGAMRDGRNRRALSIPWLMTEIATIQHKLGKKEQAEETIREAIVLFRERCGGRRGGIAYAMCRLADCLGDLDMDPLDPLNETDKELEDGEDPPKSPRYSEAIDLLSEAGSIYGGDLDQELSKGEYSYDDENGLTTRKSAHRMVNCLLQTAELHASHRCYNEGKKNFEVIMAIYRKVHVGVTDQLAGIQWAYARMLVAGASGLEAADRAGDLMAARSLYEYAVKMYRKLHGEQHESVGKCLICLGCVHIDLEEWEVALPFFDDALAVWTALEGQLEMADCHNMMGSTLQALKVHDEAVLAYHESLKIYVSIHGRLHTDVAKVTNNYATLLDDMDDKEEALFFYDEALEILVKIHGEYHPQVLVTLENLGSLLSDMGMREDAEDVEAHATAVVEKLMDTKQGRLLGMNSARRRSWVQDRLADRPVVPIPSTAALSIEPEENGDFLMAPSVQNVTCTLM